METLNSMLYLLSYNSKVTTHALGVLSSYKLRTVSVFALSAMLSISSAAPFVCPLLQEDNITIPNAMSNNNFFILLSVY